MSAADGAEALNEALNWLLDLRMAGPCDRCGHVDTLVFADRFCTECEHVPLCVVCAHVHGYEAVADGTLRYPTVSYSDHDAATCKVCALWRSSSVEQR